MFNWDAPILAVHILLINLITDTLPALALGVDPASKNIMRRPPNRSKSLFDNGLVARVCLHGCFISGATIGAFQVGCNAGGYEIGMTTAFLVLTISQLLHSLNQRSNTESIFSTGNGHNPYLFGTVAASCAVLAFILIVPALREVFRLALLSASQWLTVALFSLLPLAAVEISKCILRHREKRRLDRLMMQ